MEDGIFWYVIYLIFPETRPVLSGSGRKSTSNTGNH